MSYNVFLNDLKIVRYLYREKLSPTLISIFISPTLLLRKTKSNSQLKSISTTIIFLGISIYNFVLKFTLNLYLEKKTFHI